MNLMNSQSLVLDDLFLSRCLYFVEVENLRILAGMPRQTIPDMWYNVNVNAGENVFCLNIFVLL